MHNPQKRAPPPPSKPPPENISRSGRIPRPKGVQPGGARLAEPSRNYQLDPEWRERNGDAESEDTSRHTGTGRESLSSDEESICNELGRDSFWSSDSSERNALPSAASERWRRSSPPHYFSSGGRSITRSGPGISSSNDSHRSGWHHDDERREPRIDYCDDEELRESTNNDVDQEAGKFGTRPKDDASEEGRDRKSNQESTRGIRKDGNQFRHSKHRRRGGSASISNTDCDVGPRRDARHGNLKERSRRKDNERQVIRKKECTEGTRKVDGHESSLGFSGEERQWVSDPGSHDGDLGSSARRRGGNERQRLDGEDWRALGGSNETEEQLGKRRNRKSSWGTALESDTGYSRSGEHSSPALIRKQRHDADAAEYKKPPHSDEDSHDAEENGVAARNASSAESSLCCSKGARGQDREQSYARVEGSPAGGTEHPATAGGPGDISPAKMLGKKAGSSGVKKTPHNPPIGGSAPAGKPVRGARWGEAIGVRSQVFDTTTIPTGRAEVRDFVCSPLYSGPGTVLRCFVERSRSGAHKFSRVYSIYADLEDGSGRLLLAARKLLASKTAYYIICTRQGDLFRDSGRRGGSSFLGKLRATSTAHTEYALYDSGENPASATTAEAKGDFVSNSREKESKVSTSSEHASSTPPRGCEEGYGELRRELGVIAYNFDKKEQRTGKRRMEVAIPQVRRRGDAWERVLWQPSDTKGSMKLSFGRIRYQGGQNLLQDHRLVVFHQRESRYDPLSSCLVDFRGRATAPSVKNFQLLKSPPEDNVKRAQYYSEGAGKDERDSDDLPRPVYLQMGKVGRDCFNVDVEWPLSPLQAFAICLSRFDTNAHF